MFEILGPLPYTIFFAFRMSTAEFFTKDFRIVLGFDDTSTLVGHLCSLPEKGRKETVDEMKERDREESEKPEKIKTFPSTLTQL